MDFEDIISQIISDTTNDNPQTKAKDEQMLSAADKEAQEYSFTEYNKRDKLYSNLLDHYIASYKSKNAWNKVYKCIFFVVAMSVFLALVVGVVALFFVIVRKENTSISDIALIIGAVASIISAIIILPKIIAEHLFPTNENEHMIGMVKNMQVNDSNIRTAINKKK